MHASGPALCRHWNDLIEAVLISFWIELYFYSQNLQVSKMTVTAEQLPGNIKSYGTL